MSLSSVKEVPRREAGAANESVRQEASYSDVLLMGGLPLFAGAEAMRRGFVGGLALVLLAACSSPVADDVDVEVIPARETFATGDDAKAVLLNQSTAEITYGACDLRLERQAGDQWVRVGSEAMICTGIAYVLAAGASADVRTRIDADLAAGVYRFRMGFSLKGTTPERHVHSAPFMVQP
jgi:hypothetical protein